MGKSLAMEMVLTGDRISAQDAKEAGMSRGAPWSPSWGGEGSPPGLLQAVSTVLSGVLTAQGTAAFVDIPRVKRVAKTYRLQNDIKPCRIAKLIVHGRDWIL